MDLAGTWDLIIDQGTTFERYFRWEDSSGTARDISSYTFHMKIRKTHDDSVVIATTEGGSPTIVISQPGATGVIKVLMTAANTAALDFVRGVYDIEAMYSGGNPLYRIVQGNVTLRKEVTY